MPDQRSDSAASSRAKVFPRLLRLEEARAADPHNATLTKPEWELLAAFGLDSVAAVGRRMDELALLAAYDGAPESLTEFHVERVSSPADSPIREDETAHSGDKVQARGIVRLEFEPETRRVRLSYIVTWLNASEATKGPLTTQAGELYAVTFEAQSGAVVNRERQET